MKLQSMIAALLLTGCGPAFTASVTIPDATDSGTPPTPSPCAMVPYDGGTRSDRFLQHGSEGDFWCSADGNAVQGVSPLDPSLDGGVLCICPVDTACAPLVMENGDPAVSCWVSTDDAGMSPETSTEAGDAGMTGEISSEASPEASASLCCTVVDSNPECTAVLTMRFPCSGDMVECYTEGGNCTYTSPGTGNCGGVMGACP